MDAKTVLLVDDDVDLLDINRMTLEAEGFDVVTAENGGDAMRIATTRHVDVAILDVMMTTPTEGFLLARALRQDERTKRIPLLMLTSVNTENEAQGSSLPVHGPRPRHEVAAGRQVRRQAGQARRSDVDRAHAGRRVDVPEVGREPPPHRKRRCRVVPNRRPAVQSRRRSLVEQELINSLGWLISLRWLAGAGVLVATAVATLALRVPVPPARLYLVGGGILVYNAAFWWSSAGCSGPGRRRRGSSRRSPGRRSGWTGSR